MAFQKAGYQDALEFDPASGIIKYGNYEFFADQVGVKSIKDTFSLDTYRNSYQGQNSGMLSNGNRPKTDADWKNLFVADLQRGAVQKTTATPADNLYGGNRVERYDIGVNSPSGFSVVSDVDKKRVAPLRGVNDLGDGKFEVTTYNIPSNIEFINKLNAEAVKLSTNAAAGQVTDASRPAPSNSRLGKPNYSRAATVLAGEQNPLGGASTVLGS